MKLLTMIFLSLFLGKSCESQTQKDLKSAVLEYTANTRGFYQKITITNQTVSISKDRNGANQPTVTKISDQDWTELIADFKEVGLDSLATFKAPTEKRFYDGAPVANLKINFKQKEYKTTSFDHKYPPEKIKKLVDKINSLGKVE